VPKKPSATDMVYRVIADEALADEAMAVAQKLAAMPTEALALTKEALNATVFHGFDVAT